MTNKPTEPGFYWFQAHLENKPGQTIVFRWQVVEVDAGMYYYAKSSTGCRVDLSTGVWGPKIEEPTQC